MESNPQNHFEITQRKYDGKWEVWVTRTDAELGTLTAFDIENRVNVPITYAQFEALGSPAHLNQKRDICVAVYPDKPKVHDVLNLQAVKRRRIVR